MVHPVSVLYHTVVAGVGVIHDLLGGEDTYLPKCGKLDRVVRDTRIRRDYDDTNLDDICEREHCSRDTIYHAVPPKRKQRGRRS